MRRNRQIFRDEALQRYTQKRQKAVLPKFIPQHTLIRLWIMLILLLSGVLTIVFFLAKVWI